jgi:multidrug efflux pump subunit AcrB
LRYSLKRFELYFVRRFKSLRNTRRKTPVRSRAPSAGFSPARIRRTGVELVFSGTAEAMSASFRSLAFSHILSVLLSYLILVTQFHSYWTHHQYCPHVRASQVPGTTVNVMSSMGVVMLAGIAVSNSSLIASAPSSDQREGAAVVKR